jgi:hypothetical protein
MDLTTSVTEEQKSNIYIGSLEYEYIPAGSPKAAYNNGGYVIYFNQDFSSNIYILDRIS